MRAGERQDKTGRPRFLLLAMLGVGMTFERCDDVLRDARQGRNPRQLRASLGFTLLELMMVVTIILIVASIATPIYMTSARRTREAVLRDDLYTMRFLIDRFTLDNRRAPARLEELVEGGYLGRLPTDPFTGSNESWQAVKEDAPLSPTQTSLGIVDVHSGSGQVSLEGTPYSSWWTQAS